MSGSSRKRATSTWELTIELGADPATGKRRRRTLTFRGTRRDAEKALTDALHQRDTGFDLRPEKLTVADYLDRWLRDYALHNVARSTYHRYHSIVERHLKPQLGALKLVDLRPAHIQAAYSEYLSEGLAPRTVLQHHHILREALQQAVRWQLAYRNPADAVTPPRPERHEIRALDPHEAARLLAAATGTPVEALITVALETGMRQGELLALTWSDLDLRAGTLHILRSSRYYPGEGIVTGPTKTHRARRQLSLAGPTVQQLREHRRLQNETRLSLGPVWQDHDLVFPGPTGEPLPARNLSRTFSTIVKRAELEPLRFHDLRHTAATLMLRTGANPKTVSERLGHATVAFTLDTYAHVLPDMQRDAAEALSALIRTRP